MSKIRELYVFIMEDTEPGDEALVCFSCKGDDEEVWLPLGSPDKADVSRLSDLAQGIGKQLGKKITLVRFTGRADLKVVNDR